MLIGWIIDEDGLAHGGARREGMFWACNGVCQHLSEVVIACSKYSSPCLSVCVGGTQPGIAELHRVRDQCVIFYLLTDSLPTHSLPC